MNASPVERMMLEHDILPRQRLASHAVYPHLRLRPTPSRRPATHLLATARLRPILPRRHPARRTLYRLLPPQLAVRRRTPLARRTLPRDATASGAGQLARPRHAATPPQRRPGRRLAQALATPPAAVGRGPDPYPLPRPARPRPPRTVSRSGQERHHSLPRLRHRLPDPPRPTLHPGVDDGLPGREVGGGAATLVASLPQPGRAAPAVAVGPGFLDRGRDSLFASGTLPLSDAGDRAGQEGRGGRRAQRQPGLLDLATGRLEYVHPARDGRRPQGHGVDLRSCPQSRGSSGSSRPRALGLCLLALSDADAVGGKPVVSSSLRHRDELSSVERGACQDVQS